MTRTDSPSPIWSRLAQAKAASAPPHLRSTLSGVSYPFTRLEEFTDSGESLEVVLPWIESGQSPETSVPRPAADAPQARHPGGPAAGLASPGPAVTSWERYAALLPFARSESSLSLGEGSTPLVPAGPALEAFTGIEGLLLKNETANPTWSFKDRGSVTCTAMARQEGEGFVATISTGNMGNSLAAYGARAGLGVIVFLPAFVPKEKILAMAIHGARCIRVSGCDYMDIKKQALGLAGRLGLRVVSGNGPIRAEGYKLEAFEILEQLGGTVPDLVVVPTSACGHVRGIFKGFRELVAAGLATKLPRMVVVQAANNSPLASAIRAESLEVKPFRGFHTVAEALTSGDPPGGAEILHKARDFGWLAGEATEDEILESQRLYARSGFFVEPGTATTLAAIRNLRAEGRIRAGERVVVILTGSGLKDFGVVEAQFESNTAASTAAAIADCGLEGIESCVESILAQGGGR